MVIAVSLDLQIHIDQQVGIHIVLRILDDDFLAIDMALGPQTKDAHEDALIEVDVEDDGILIGLIGEENGNR